MIEDRGLLAPFVVVDAVVDIESPLSGRPTITATPLLSLESVSELLQKESILFDLGLKLMELLEVKTSKFLMGGVLVPRCWEFDARRCGVACPLMRRGAIAYPFILIAHSQHPELDDEALTSGIVSAFVIGVGVAEAVVACGQELAQSPRVVESGEIHSGPCLVLIRGVGVDAQVKSEALAAFRGMLVSGSVSVGVRGGGISPPEGVWGWCRRRTLLRLDRLLKEWWGGA